MIPRIKACSEIIDALFRGKSAAQLKEVAKQVKPIEQQSAGLASSVNTARVTTSATRRRPRASRAHRPLICRRGGARCSPVEPACFRRLVRKCSGAFAFKPGVRRCSGADRACKTRVR
jgi:hypothetical protein